MIFKIIDSFEKLMNPWACSLGKYLYKGSGQFMDTLRTLNQTGFEQTENHSTASTRLTFMMLRLSGGDHGRANSA